MEDTLTALFTGFRISCTGVSV